MADLARCTRCGFVVPWDEIGRALMTEHLREHSRRPKDGTDGARVMERLASPPKDDPDGLVER